MLSQSASTNYGAFLQDKKQDLKGAEKSYLRALELDPNHVNALGNLANRDYRRNFI